MKKNSIAIIFILFIATFVNAQVIPVGFIKSNDLPCIPGNQAKALNFSGSLQNYASLPSGTYFSGDFTIECWVKPTSHTNWSRIIDFGNSTSNNVVFATSYQLTGKPAIHINGGEFFANSQIPLNQWTHLAATLSGTTATIYINGIASGSSTLNVPANVIRNDNFIGRSNWGWGDDAPDATFDDLRIWNVAKTASQIQASMNRELTGNESGLTAYFKFNEGICCDNNLAITTLINSASSTGSSYNATLSGFTLNQTCTSNYVTGKVVANNGLSSTRPGTSAFQIKQDYPNSVDGVYWIANPNINGGVPFQIYADMTSYGGGWTLLNSSGGPVAPLSTEIPSITSLSTRGFLPRSTVIELANISTTVQLRAGPTNNTFTYVTTSSDIRPILSLRNTSSAYNGAGTWHNSVYTSFVPNLGTWTWVDVRGVATGWPNMFHSNGTEAAVHWIPGFDYACGITYYAGGYYFSTWIK